MSAQTRRYICRQSTICGPSPPQAFRPDLKRPGHAVVHLRHRLARRVYSPTAGYASMSWRANSASLETAYLLIWAICPASISCALRERCPDAPSVSFRIRD